MVFPFDNDSYVRIIDTGCFEQIKKTKQNKIMPKKMIFHKKFLEVAGSSLKLLLIPILKKISFSNHFRNQ